GALRALTVTFLIPPFGILWGYFFLDERLSAGFVAGVAAIGIAVWLVVGEQNPAKNHDVPLRK
ncbi:MAG: EamA/RhaT family transporter, partial [Gibbsiella quercinecans]